MYNVKLSYNEKIYQEYISKMKTIYSYGLLVQGIFFQTIVFSRIKETTY